MKTPLLFIAAAGLFALSISGCLHQMQQQSECEMLRTESIQLGHAKLGQDGQLVWIPRPDNE